MITIFIKKKKNNPDKYRKYLEKERERYLQRKKTGEIKTIKDLSAKEQRKQRRSWRLKFYKVLSKT